jgi:hypothetical protein
MRIRNSLFTFATALAAAGVARAATGAACHCTPYLPATLRYLSSGNAAPLYLPRTGRYLRGAAAAVLRDSLGRLHAISLRFVACGLAANDYCRAFCQTPPLRRAAGRRHLNAFFTATFTCRCTVSVRDICSSSSVGGGSFLLLLWTL